MQADIAHPPTNRSGRVAAAHPREEHSRRLPHGGRGTDQSEGAAPNRLPRGRGGGGVFGGALAGVGEMGGGRVSVGVPTGGDLVRLAVARGAGRPADLDVQAGIDWKIVSTYEP
eukprot:715956-Pyramimonas_sp.AAC.1